MARYYGQDVRDTIITVLGDSSSGFDAKIGDINSERSHTSPTANSITYEWGRNQYPFIMVNVDSDEVVFDDTEIGLNLNNLAVTHNVLVMGFLKGADDNIYNWVEDWIEAVIKTLHKYQDSNIGWVAWTNTDRAEIYDKQNQVLKSFAVTFEVRVHGG